VEYGGRGVVSFTEREIGMLSTCSEVKSRQRKGVDGGETEGLTRRDCREWKEKD